MGIRSIASPFRMTMYRKPNTNPATNPLTNRSHAPSIHDFLPRPRASDMTPPRKQGYPTMTARKSSPHRALYNPPIRTPPATPAQIHDNERRTVPIQNPTSGGNMNPKLFARRRS